MPNLTDVAANAALDAMGPLFASLHVGDPTDTGAGAPSTGFPDRVAATLGAAAARARTNTAATSWSTPSTVDETISHVSLWDAAAGGSCRWRGPLVAPVPVVAGGLFDLPPGSLSVSID